MDNQAAFGPEDLKVRRAGVDVNLTYGGLNLFGVYTFGREIERNYIDRLLKRF